MWRALGRLSGAVMVMGVGINAVAQQGVNDEIGVLTCALADEQPGISVETAISPGTRDMLCSFHHGPNGVEEAYTGTIQSVGQRGEAYAQSVMMWSVRGPIVGDHRAGTLQQSFAIEHNTPVGTNAPLVGDENREISLQPVTSYVNTDPGLVGSSKAIFVLIVLWLKATPT